MPEIKVRLDDVESPKPVTEGDHVVEVTDATVVQAKQSETQMLRFEFTIVDGEDKGRKLYHNSSLEIDPQKDPDGDKTKTALSFLKETLEALNFQWNPDGFDPEDIVGHQAIARVRNEEYEGREQSRVARLFPIKT